MLLRPSHIPLHNNYRYYKPQKEKPAFGGKTSACETQYSILNIQQHKFFVKAKANVYKQRTLFKTKTKKTLSKA